MNDTHNTDSQLVETKNSFANSLTELIRYIIVAAIIVIPVRLFIAQPFIVNGASMFPAFATGDYLIVDELSYNLGDPTRGDVAIFKYPLDESKFFVKRVVGLPGETVTITGGAVAITTIDGKTLALDEPYLQNHSNENFSLTLDEEEYFVLGDNRTNSSDSRIWGALPAENLVGKAFVRLFPLTEIDFAPGAHTYELPLTE